MKASVKKFVEANLLQLESFGRKLPQRSFHEGLVVRVRFRESFRENKFSSAKASVKQLTSTKAFVKASVKTFVEANLLKFKSFGKSKFTSVKASVKASVEANFLPRNLP